MLRSITRFTVIGCTGTLVVITCILGRIMPSLPQPTPEPSSSDAQSAIPDREAFIRAVKQRFPGFYTFEDLSPKLKARAVRKNGIVEITIPKGEITTLPNGDRYEADGSLIKKNGVRFQPVMKDGKFQRNRIFKPDGTEMKPGEKYTAPDGMKIELSDEQEGRN